MPGSPRAHGGQPLATKASLYLAWVSPYSRGSTAVDRPGRCSRRGLPVLTGVNRLPGTSSRTWTRSPRAHGGQPVSGAGGSGIPSVSPCSRGSTAEKGLATSSIAGLPVLTGVNRGPGRCRSRSRRSPRAHGGQPLGAVVGVGGVKVSPCSRGSTFTAREVLETWRGLPVLTGVNPCPRRAGPSSRWSPRAHGGQPLSVFLQAHVEQVSPCSRGSTLTTDDPESLEDGLPVLTGVNPSAPSPSRPARRSPRAHGGQPLFGPCPRAFPAVSPCSRGSTPGQDLLHQHRQGLPVLTGVNPRSRASPPPAGGGLPCSRGSTPGRAEAEAHYRGLPVLTGVNRDAAFVRGDLGRSPRAHGGQPLANVVYQPYIEVSPCSRGSTGSAPRAWHRSRGLPVLTGVNPSIIP